MNYLHQPVMLSEALRYLDPVPGDVICDATCGGGGHSLEIARLIGESGVLIGIDRDPQALAAAGKKLEGAPCRVILARGNYGDMAALLSEAGYPNPDGVLFDFGVSSHQLDTAQRGFTYRADAPLDMRMDPDGPVTAADILNTASADDLERIISEYGEERWASRIAEFIVDRRKTAPLRTSSDLVDVIYAAVPRGARRGGPHPARRTFQALRIAVNDELGSVERGVAAAIDIVQPGGRIVAISYHSLEDRVVKEAFRRAERPCTCPPSLPLCVCGKVKILEVLTRKPIGPTDEEVRSNPRSRSAKLRAAKKVLVA